MKKKYLITTISLTLNVVGIVLCNNPKQITQNFVQDAVKLSNIKDTTYYEKQRPWINNIHKLYEYINTSILPTLSLEDQKKILPHVIDNLTDYSFKLFNTIQVLKINPIVTDLRNWNKANPNLIQRYLNRLQKELNELKKFKTKLIANKFSNNKNTQILQQILIDIYIELETIYNKIIKTMNGYLLFHRKVQGRMEKHRKTGAR